MSLSPEPSTTVKVAVTGIVVSPTLTRVTSTLPAFSVKEYLASLKTKLTAGRGTGGGTDDTLVDTVSLSYCAAVDTSHQYIYVTS